jgi:hypothetical protein
MIKGILVVVLLVAAFLFGPLLSLYGLNHLIINPCEGTELSYSLFSTEWVAMSIAHGLIGMMIFGLTALILVGFFFLGIISEELGSKILLYGLAIAVIVVALIFLPLLTLWCTNVLFLGPLGGTLLVVKLFTFQWFVALIAGGVVMGNCRSCKTFTDEWKKKDKDSNKRDLLKKSFEKALKNTQDDNYLGPRGYKAYDRKNDDR